MKMTILMATAAVTSFNVLAVPPTSNHNGTTQTPEGITFSGTQTTQDILQTEGSNERLTTSATAVRATSFYNIVSNAVANADLNYGGALNGTNLPANGYIAYNPTNNDGMVNGTFYVTNRQGFYYPLSGYDNNGAYYSYVELNTYYNDPNNDLGQLDLGFGNPTNSFDGVATENFNTSTGNGTASITAPATFYIHDNPYNYNTSSSPSAFYGMNGNAVALNGNATINYSYRAGNVVGESVSLNGTGAAMNGTGQNTLVNGTVGFSQGTLSQPGSTGTGGNGGGTGSPYPTSGVPPGEGLPPGVD